MKTLLPYLFSAFAFFAFTSCDTPEREGEIDPNEVVEQTQDYEDDDPDDATIEWEDQSARLGGVTTETTDYDDSESGNRFVEPIYTDNEYEWAYSTSTTNPRNQVEGGITPGDNR